MKLAKNLIMSLGSVFTLLAVVIPVSATHAGGGVHYDQISVTAALFLTGYLFILRVKAKLAG